jgi:hypothetical protein
VLQAGDVRELRPLMQFRIGHVRAVLKVVATAALGLLLGAGCYRNAGSVVAAIHKDSNGALHYTTCDLITGRSIFNIGDDDLEHCVDESGNDVPSPTPMQRHALEMPNTTHDAGAK